MSNKLVGRLTISKRNVDTKYVSIRLKDNTSKIHFTEIDISLENFAEAITGLGEVPCVFTVTGLENVGKIKVVENRQVLCPLAILCKKEELKQWLLDNCQEEGWIIDTYLESQESIKYTENGMILNYSVFKYVEAETLI